MSAARVTTTHPAGPDHQVVNIVGGGSGYRRQPCATCPWRVDMIGEFPAEAFKISAHTSHDMDGTLFGCHSSGKDRPATCAGFLLKGAQHNLAYRMACSRGEIDPRKVHDGGHPLFENYRQMAVANGVPADDAALKNCR